MKTLFNSEEAANRVAARLTKLRGVEYCAIGNGPKWYVREKAPKGVVAGLDYGQVECKILASSDDDVGKGLISQNEIIKMAAGFMEQEDAATPGHFDPGDLQEFIQKMMTPKVGVKYVFSENVYDVHFYEEEYANSWVVTISGKELAQQKHPWSFVAAKIVANVGKNKLVKGLVSDAEPSTSFAYNTHMTPPHYIWHNQDLAFCKAALYGESAHFVQIEVPDASVAGKSVRYLGKSSLKWFEITGTALAFVVKVHVLKKNKMTGLLKTAKLVTPT
jgi:hypothetical protein